MFCNLIKQTRKTLIEKCKEVGLKGYSSKNKKEIISLLEKNLKIQPIISSEKDNYSRVLKEKNKLDSYSKDVLEQCYNLHKSYTIGRKELCKNLNIKIRLPSIPEDISENIVKFIIHKNGDKTSTWSCSTGDLYSEIEGKQECKCFTSNGPISFTPCSEWDIIYFLDSRDWLNNNFKLYKVNLKKSSEEWKNIPVNKTQTFQDQCNQGRRPRIEWDMLYKYINPYCEKVFDGSFEDILKAPVSTRLTM